MPGMLLQCQHRIASPPGCHFNSILAPWGKGKCSPNFHDLCNKNYRPARRWRLECTCSWSLESPPLQADGWKGQPSTDTSGYPQPHTVGFLSEQLICHKVPKNPTKGGPRTQQDAQTQAGLSGCIQTPDWDPDGRRTPGSIPRASEGRWHFTHVSLQRASSPAPSNI